MQITNEKLDEVIDRTWNNGYQRGFEDGYKKALSFIRTFAERLETQQLSKDEIAGVIGDC